MILKKSVHFDKRADKEIKQFPSTVQAKIKALVHILAREGEVEEPFGKKIDTNLFELRIKHKGQWRVLYTYLVKEYIIILSAFHKKTQKTPIKELERARFRLKEYV